MIEVKKIAELTGHNGAVYALEQAENPESFYSGSSDNIVAKWNLETLSAEKFAARFSSIVYSLCLVPEKNILLAGTSEGKIHVIDLKEKKEIKILQNHTQPVFDIKYGPPLALPLNKGENSAGGGGIILSASGDGTIAIISTENFSTIKIIKLCNEKLRAIDIYENHAAIACGDGMIRIIDLAGNAPALKGEIQATLGKGTNSIYSVKFSPDGKYLLSGGKDAHLNKWLFQPQTSDFELETSIPAHNYAIYSIVFSPDEKLFATASRDKTIKIWNAETFELLLRINKENHEGHINSVNKLLWSNFSNYLISTGDDRKIMIWEIKG